jgi:hypothetical protein
MSSTPSARISSPAAISDVALSYRIHMSQRYLDLTRQKLQLTRLAKEVQSRQPGQWKHGVTKAELEQLVDHWMEDYDWRAQEKHINDTLPQYRLVMEGTRVSFVHKRCSVLNAMPLIFVHGWPESFIGVSHRNEMRSK